MFSDSFVGPWAIFAPWTLLRSVVETLGLVCGFLEAGLGDSAIGREPGQASIAAANRALVVTRVGRRRRLWPGCRRRKPNVPSPFPPPHGLFRPSDR